MDDLKKKKKLFYLFSKKVLTVTSVHLVDNFRISETEIIPFLTHKSLQMGITGYYCIFFEHSTAKGLKTKININNM